MHKTKGTLAIDFDGTIVTHAYPYIGELKDGAKNALYAQGWQIVIWSCRNNPELGRRLF